MYAVLTLNLIVNCVTLISSLLLITGAIRVSHEIAAIDNVDLDSESELNITFYFFIHSETRCLLCRG